MEVIDDRMKNESSIIIKIPEERAIKPVMDHAMFIYVFKCCSTVGCFPFCFTF